VFQMMRYSTSQHTPILRSFRRVFNARIYEHLVPAGLVKLVAMLSLLLLIGCDANRFEPVALAPEDVCSYCKMAISQKRYAAELIDSEGQAFKFDDIGCMINFIKGKKNPAKTVAHFVMDFDERQWLKAEDACYVRAAELSTPMNGGIIAFKTESRAQEAAGKYQGKRLGFADLFKNEH